MEGEGCLGEMGLTGVGWEGHLGEMGVFSDSEPKNKELRNWLTMFRFGGMIKKA